MQIIYTKVRPEICKQNREYYKNHIRKVFVMWCAYEGLFNDVFTKHEIEKAKRGILPEDCNVHHKIPLSGTNEPIVHSFSNLVVLHVKTHKRINREIFAPQLRPLLKEPYGTSIKIEVPDYNYVDVSGIQRERLNQFLMEKIYGKYKIK